MAYTMYRQHDEAHRLQAPTSAPQQARGPLARLPARLRVAFLAALASLALVSYLLAAPPGQSARAAPAAPARANLLSCNGPCVGITNPLYSSNGQLVAEGPVGAILTVEGANWPNSTSVTVWPAADAATCTAQLAQPPGYAGTINVNGQGYAQGTYTWPQQAGGVNQTYTLCAVDGTTTVPAGVQSNGIDLYTVLSASAPSVTVSPTTITQGQDNTITVSGQNWFAPQQPITVTVCTDASCTAGPIASQTTTAQDGTFQITLTIKAGTAPGAYFVQASTANQALKAPSGGPPQLTVSTPTPTPSPTPSPTATPTPNTTPSTSGKGGTTLLVVLLGTLSLLFLIGGIISIAVYVRSGG
jgi:hypothetical protein